MNESAAACAEKSNAINPSPKNIETFWSRVKKGQPDDCWPMHGANFEGYPTMSIRRRSKRANRVSWEIHKGPIPSGLWVLHKCDNPPCVNPNHLWLGTPQDNIADMVAKNRQARGSTHGSVTKPGRLPKGEENNR